MEKLDPQCFWCSPKKSMSMVDSDLFFSVTAQPSSSVHSLTESRRWTECMAVGCKHKTWERAASSWRWYFAVTTTLTCHRRQTRQAGCSCRVGKPREMTLRPPYPLQAVASTSCPMLDWETLDINRSSAQARRSSWICKSTTAAAPPCGQTAKHLKEISQALSQASFTVNMKLTILDLSTSQEKMK